LWLNTFHKIDKVKNMTLKDAENRFGYVLAVLIGIVFLIGGYYLVIPSLMGFGILAIVVTLGIYIYENGKGEIK
jgi:hypothetical protein